ncbi:MAG TPA: 3D domain-containing protein [Candidatus Babeliales bacterium]|nr:3D domain-containing protein [Candidatus Babeliales bacterium]
MIGRVLCASFAVAMLGLPAIAAPGPVTHVAWHRGGLLTWERTAYRPIAPPTVHRLSTSLAPWSTKVIAAGKAGILEIVMRYSQRDGGPVHGSVVSATVVRPAAPRIVADGIAATSLSRFEARGIEHMALFARSAMLMLATAYTADCSGCDGMTALGRRAGHGIVAVDPRVIPIGTRLYIPGYGFAIAGDTGGAIVGRRIDLGFDSNRDALMFGRRDVMVYRLR